jgi:hypothetical protein
VLVIKIALGDGDGLEIAQYVLALNPEAGCVFIADYPMEYIREEFPQNTVVAWSHRVGKHLQLVEGPKFGSLVVSCFTGGPGALGGITTKPSNGRNFFCKLTTRVANE